MTRVATVSLPKSLQAVLLAGHPWVYRDQLPPQLRAAHGSWLHVVCGPFEGYALFDAQSALALRVFSRTRVPDESWLRMRVQEAWEAREAVRATGTNAFRWLAGEGDSLPGIVADYYAGYVVLVLDSTALVALVEPLSRALTSVAELSGILLRTRDMVRPRLVWGKPAPADLVIRENQLRMHANLWEGQKTGLFLDHRENRHLLETYCAGKRVLNLFAYSGAFSLYALRGGAALVVNVDSAAQAQRDAEANARLNGFELERCRFETEDVFAYLERQRARNEHFDVVICDPPSFARNQAQLKRALAAYERVNAAALKVTAQRGIYAAASCTARVTPALFQQMLATAASRAKRRLQVIQERGQALDHPYQAVHAEGRYLKFVLGRVSERV